MEMDYSVLSEDQLEEHRQEIENRIKNLFWTISGDYSLEIKPDIETFAHSKALALYDAIKQGAFADFFDTRALSLYLLQKCYLGADRYTLLELSQLCIDAAVYPLANAQRKGVSDIRKEAFLDLLEMEAEDTHSLSDEKTKLISEARTYIAKRFLEQPTDQNTSLLSLISHIDNMEQVKDTEDFIQRIDHIYNTYFDPSFAAKVGSLEKVKEVTVQELLENQKFITLTDDQIDHVLDEYAEILKTEILKMKLQKNKGRKRHSFAPVFEDEEIVEPDPEDLEKVYNYIERQFGKSYVSRLDQERLCRRLCTGIHKRCTLYFTEGILHNPAIKNTSFLRGSMVQMKNELYFKAKSASTQRNVNVLASMLKTAQIICMDDEVSRSDHGTINPSRLWKVGRTHDNKLFDERKKNEAKSFAIDILIDSSSSQVSRQPQIAVQAYIISQALSKADIPHRVSSFCSYWDYTILHRFRDYDDDEASNMNIMQFHAFGENRDGLAIRTIADSLTLREEENKILIILSDGRPNNIGSKRKGSRQPKPYFGDEAVKDTALEIRKLRNSGVNVLGIFVGSDEDLYTEKKIFGKDFVSSKKISSFSHIVGNYLKKQMTMEF